MSQGEGKLQGVRAGLRKDRRVAFEAVGELGLDARDRIPPRVQCEEEIANGDRRVRRRDPHLLERQEPPGHHRPEEVRDAQEGCREPKGPPSLR